MTAKQKQLPLFREPDQDLFIVSTYDTALEDTTLHGWRAQFKALQEFQLPQAIRELMAQGWDDVSIQIECPTTPERDCNCIYDFLNAGP